MPRFCFRVGLEVRIEGVPYRFAGRVAGGWQLVRLSDNLLENKQRQELWRLYVAGLLIYDVGDAMSETEAERVVRRQRHVVPLADRSAKEQQRARSALKIIRAVDDRMLPGDRCRTVDAVSPDGTPLFDRHGVAMVDSSGKPKRVLRLALELRAICTELGFETPISVATYYRMVEQYGRSNETHDLIPNFSGRGNRKQLHDSVQNFLRLEIALVLNRAPASGLPRSVFHSLIGHLSPQELMHFVVFIGTEPTPLVRHRGTLFNNVLTSGKISSLVGRAAAVLADWPRAFHTLIASSRGVRHNPKAPVSEFDSTRNYLRDILSSTQFDFARAELDAYLRSDWNADFEKSVSAKYTALRDVRAEYFSAHQAARQLGYDEGSVRARIISGEIPGHVIWKTRPPRYFVERQWIAATLHEASEQGRTKPSIILKGNSPPPLPDFLPAKISAHLLGVHLGQLYQLATEGLIIRSADTHAFEHSSLTNLLKRLEAVANELDQGQTKTAFLDIAAAGARYRPLTLSKILKEALDGKLPIFLRTGFPESGLRRFAVPYDLLRGMQLNLQLHEAEGMSYRAAAHILRGSLDNIKTLVHLELLTQRQTMDGRRARDQTLLSIEVRKFANDYVLCRPLRERFGINVREHLAKLGVFPVINSPAPRSLLAWDRAEIESVEARLQEGLNEK